MNTVSRRLAISTLTSLRLLTRAPCTRIRSWLSAFANRSLRSRLRRELAGSLPRRQLRARFLTLLIVLGNSWRRIRLPAGSRKAQSRTPYGWSIGSWTTSAALACIRAKAPSRSLVARRMIA